MPDGPMRVRVLVADDHPVYLDGLVAAIGRAPDLELVASCADGTQALACIRALAPDVAVLDLRMPILSALDVLEALHEERLTTRVLVLSAFADGATVHGALSAGAAGYLVKEAPRSRICEAIRAIAAGRAVIGEAAQTEMALELRNPRDLPGLTRREREILALLADGLSAREIRRAARARHGDRQDPPAQPVREARRHRPRGGGGRGDAPGRPALITGSSPAPTSRGRGACSRARRPG